MVTYSPELEQSLIEAQDVVVWEMPSFQQYERGTAWYVTLGVVSLFLLAYAVWTTNFLFAFLILLADIMMMLTAHQTPEPILVQIGENGIVLGGKLILFQNIQRFAIVYQPPEAKVLYLEQKSVIQPHLRIELADQDPLALRAHLRQYVRENLDLQNEYPSDTIARLLKI